MNIRIRQATIEDLELITSFNTKLCTKEHNDFDETVNPDFALTQAGERYFTNNINSDTNLTLVAEVENKAVGYLICSIEKVSEYRNISHMCEIDNMWVDQQYRNHKIGKQLLDTAKGWSKKQGVRRMRVIASAQNHQAINFYKREDFNEYDIILEQNIY